MDKITKSKSLERKLPQKNEAGQGLLETVIALSIIITGLTGALSLAVNNLQATGASGSRVIAGNLGREGVEVARALRDSNWLKGCPNPVDEESCFRWDSGLFDPENPGDHTAVPKFDGFPPRWRLDFTPNNIDSDEAGLKRDNFLYNYDSGDPTPFNRLLTLDEICGEENPPEDCAAGICGEGFSCAEKIGVRIISEVKWKERGVARGLIIEDRLYNWR